MINADWEELARRCQQGESGVRIVSPQGAVPVYACMNLGGIQGPALAVATDLASVDGRRMPRCKGFEVTVEATSEGDTRIVIRPTAGRVDVAFLTTANSVCETCSSVSNPAEAARATLGILEALQKFFTRSSDDLPTREEMVGMYGEIRVLLDIVIPCWGPAKAVRNWIGPLDGKQDWLGDSVALEVKTSSAPKDTIRISSVDQLDGEGLDLLFLCYVRLREDSVGETLEALVSRAIKTLGREGSAAADFLTKIRAVGWTDENLARTEYQVPFAAERPNIFKVCDLPSHRFPRYGRSSIIPGTSLLGYDIRTISLTPFQTASSTAITEIKEHSK